MTVQSSSAGAEGEAAPQFWLQPWSAKEVVRSLQSTSGFNHAPGALLIAPDGGGTMFAIDTRGGDPGAMRFVQFGLPVIDWQDAEHSEPTLDAFLVYLRTAD